MARDINHVFHGILEAIDRAGELLRGVSLPEFEAGWRTKYAVQRCIEIISEASRGIPDSWKETHPDIPWTNVRDIGNVLRHRYESIADPLIWRVVIDELPKLRGAIVSMREQIGSQ